MPWELETTELTLAYQPLQMTTAVEEVAVVPISLAEDFVFAVPALVTPLLPTYMVAMADLLTGEASADGQTV